VAAAAVAELSELDCCAPDSITAEDGDPADDAAAVEALDGGSEVSLHL
jgi:hypothetical protein